jgi:hypothetical protein
LPRSRASNAAAAGIGEEADRYVTGITDQAGNDAGKQLLVAI